MLWSEKADQSFPALATVVEVDEPTEEITEIIEESDEEDIDPDDAAAGSPKADDNSSRGIGLTLKKIPFTILLLPSHFCSQSLKMGNMQD
ncbi:hypothetical protein PtB15_6B751 [Puccinia triticina]|nr:hypothetical protein PtB15_6B751 [Puccinia triticina]